MSKLYNLPSTFLRNIEACHSLLCGRTCYSCNHWHSVCQSGMQFLLHQMRFNESWITKRCEEMSDDTKQSRFILIQSLNGTDIIIKFLLFIFLELLKSTSVLSLNFLLFFRWIVQFSLRLVIYFLLFFFL